jgi:hypothetical protein
MMLAVTLLHFRPERRMEDEKAPVKVPVVYAETVTGSVERTLAIEITPKMMLYLLRVED